MQPQFHQEPNKRNYPPKPGNGMAPDSSNVQPEQEDQWAVLRHEVEDEYVMRNDENNGRERSDRDQRDTEDDAYASPNPYDYYDQAPKHVDIVVAGVGGGGGQDRLSAGHVGFGVGHGGGSGH